LYLHLKKCHPLYSAKKKSLQTKERQQYPHAVKIAEEVVKRRSFESIRPTNGIGMKLGSSSSSSSNSSSSSLRARNKKIMSVNGAQ